MDANTKYLLDKIDRSKHEVLTEIKELRAEIGPLKEFRAKVTVLAFFVSSVVSFIIDAILRR